MREQKAEAYNPSHGEAKAGGSESEFEVSLGHLSRSHFNKEKLLEEKRKEIWPFLYVETWNVPDLIDCEMRTRLLNLLV